MSNIYDALESQLDILYEKLTTLREDYAYETDAAQKFKLEHNIKEVENEINDIKNKRQEDNYQKIYHSLLRLGYSQQIIYFRDFIKTESMGGGAFLIYPSLQEEYAESYGQKWLLNRLIIQNLPRCTTAKVLRIEFNRYGRQNDQDLRKNCQKA
jgi:hypothetical protein